MTESLPSRGAWIEMLPSCLRWPWRHVAPLAGSVDRNKLAVVAAGHLAVAPLAGSVDRNISRQASCILIICRSPRGERG